MAYGSYYPQQTYQQTPLCFSGAPGVNSVHPQYHNMQSTHTGSTSYLSFFPVHSSDYNFSQPTSEELQQTYVTGGYPLTQLPANTSGVASFGPMMAAQVEPIPDLNFSPPTQVIDYGPHSPCRSTPSNNLDRDELRTCGPVRKKPRRQFSDREREQMKSMRKIGNCARCKSMKLRVSQASAPDTATACIYLSLRIVNLSAIKATRATGVWKTDQRPELILGHASEGIRWSSCWSVRVSRFGLQFCHAC